MNNPCTFPELRSHKERHGGISTWVMPNGSLVCTMHGPLGGVMGRLIVEAHRADMR